MTTQPMKRVEIVIDSLHLERVLEALQTIGVSGYTVLPNAEGFGDRGEQYGDEVSGVSTNTYILVAATENLVRPIGEAMEPLLRKYGGICLISDCQWLEH